MVLLHLVDFKRSAHVTRPIRREFVELRRFCGREQRQQQCSGSFEGCWGRRGHERVKQGRSAIRVVEIDTKSRNEVGPAPGRSVEDVEEELESGVEEEARQRLPSRR